MLGLLVFFSFFFLFFSVTLIVPYLPPGQIMCAVLGNSETSYPVAGISGESLIAGVVNGLVWGVVIVVLYCYSRGPHRGKVILPVWVPGYTTSRASTTERRQFKWYRKSSSSEVKETENVPIESVDGIGQIYGHMLRDLGVDCVDDLLVIGSTKTGREYLASKLNESPVLIARWVIAAKTLM